MEEKPKTFRLIAGTTELTAEPISDRRWRVLGGTEFRKGDEVCARTLAPWHFARERMGVRRTRVSPRSLVLLKGADEPKSRREILALLTEVPWAPQSPEPAA